jgi:hypothetical protein
LWFRIFLLDLFTNHTQNKQAMSYSLVPSTKHEHKFQQNSMYGIFTFVFGFVGLLAATISGYLVYIGLDTQGWAITVTGLGVLFMAVGFYIPQARKKYDAQEIIFDHENSQVIFKDNYNNIAIIPYQKIEKIDIRQKAMSSSSGSNTHRHYKYFVFLATKDNLLTWEFYDSNTLKKAEKICKELAHLVLNKEIAISSTQELSNTKAKFSEKLQVKQEQNKYKIRWKNNATKYVGLFAVILLVFGRVIWQMWQEISKDSIAILGFGFFMLILTIIFGVIIWNIYTDLQYSYVLEVEPEKLSYSKEKSIHEVETKTWNSDELLGICFNFFIEESQNSFKVLTKAQYTKEKDTKTNAKLDMQTIKNLFEVSKNTVLLKIESLNAVESLQFQQKVNEVIKKQ